MPAQLVLDPGVAAAFPTAPWLEVEQQPQLEGRIGQRHLNPVLARELEGIADVGVTTVRRIPVEEGPHLFAGSGLGQYLFHDLGGAQPIGVARVTVLQGERRYASLRVTFAEGLIEQVEIGGLRLAALGGDVDDAL